MNDNTENKTENNTEEEIENRNEKEFDENKNQELTIEQHYEETSKRQSLRIKDLEYDNEILKKTLIKKEERIIELEDNLQKFKKLVRN